MALDSSVPANNHKIIELYNRLKINQICINTDYQRKLVWKRSHKFNFIDTILKNYPFPEIYLAPGTLDPIELILIDEIVDGQQRLTTIRNYIEGVDVFADKKLPIKRFSELESDEKILFLNYEVSVRYLKNATQDQVREIFQRINKTEYGLNSTEKLNAQWGDSEFVCFSKQIVEKEFKSDSVIYKIPDEERTRFIKFFHGEFDTDQESVFSGNDISRMYALQYVMSILATLDVGEYFSRTDKIDRCIQDYNEDFYKADEIKNILLHVIDFIGLLELSRDSIWFNKANLFTLIIELSKVDLTGINSELLSEKLNELALNYTMVNLGSDDYKLTTEQSKYFDYAREAVNEKNAREYRGKFISSMLNECNIMSL